MTFVYNALVSEVLAAQATRVDAFGTLRYAEAIAKELQARRFLATTREHSQAQAVWRARLAARQAVRPSQTSPETA